MLSVFSLYSWSQLRFSHAARPCHLNNSWSVSNSCPWWQRSGKIRWKIKKKLLHNFKFLIYLWLMWLYCKCWVMNPHQSLERHVLWDFINYLVTGNTSGWLKSFLNMLAGKEFDEVSLMKVGRAVIQIFESIQFPPFGGFCSSSLTLKRLLGGSGWFLLTRSYSM